MPEPKTLHDMFLDELRDAYDAEKQLIKALPKLARAAVSEELRTAFTSHLSETQGHVQRLEQAFATLGQKPRGKHCDGIAGIIEEGKSVLEEDIDQTAIDACLIAAGQRAEHYEMAAYGSLIAWAHALGLDEAAELLEQNLAEEKAADQKLTTLGEGGINEQAARGAQGGDENEEEDEEADTAGRPAKKSHGRAKSAAHKTAAKKKSAKR